VRRVLDGDFAQIPHAILEGMMRTKLSPCEVKILALIFRKTYGWHEDRDWISLSQFTLFTGIARPNVIRTLRRLQERNIIIVRGAKYRPKVYSMNEHYQSWVGYMRPKDKVIRTDNDVITTDNSKLSALIPTKHTITKQTIPKQTTVVGSGNGNSLSLSKTHPLENTLRGLGMRKPHRLIGEYGKGKVWKAMLYFVSQSKRGVDIESPAGYIRKALEEEWDMGQDDEDYDDGRILEAEYCVDGRVIAQIWDIPRRKRP
jgi:phage replication O-like protein O